jgi:hypothetical protein
MNLVEIELPNDGVSCPPILQTQPNFTLKKLTENRAAYLSRRRGSLTRGWAAFFAHEVFYCFVIKASFQYCK